MSRKSRTKIGSKKGKTAEKQFGLRTIIRHLYGRIKALIPWIKNLPRRIKACIPRIILVLILWIKNLPCRIRGEHRTELSPAERELKRPSLEWEMDKHLSLFKDYFDYSIKIVGIFGAVVGGILTLAYSTNINLQCDVKKILLIAIVIMSGVMSFIFWLGALLWYQVVTEMKWVARQIDMKIMPKAGYLSLLLVIFASLFLFLAWALYGLASDPKLQCIETVDPKTQVGQPQTKPAEPQTQVD